MATVLEPPMVIGGYHVPKTDRRIWSHVHQDAQYHRPINVRSSGGCASITCFDCNTEFRGTTAEAIRKWNDHLGVKR